MKEAPPPRYIYYEKLRSTSANLVAGFSENEKLLSAMLAAQIRISRFDSESACLLCQPDSRKSVNRIADVPIPLPDCQIINSEVGRSVTWWST